MVFAVVLSASVAQAERRVALVIGNSTYRNASPLPNTINDANAVAALFRSVGFEVVNSRNELGVLEFKRAVREFLITAETADIAVVYYAGHGMEVNGANFLILSMPGSPATTTSRTRRWRSTASSGHSSRCAGCG